MDWSKVKTPAQKPPDPPAPRLMRHLWTLTSAQKKLVSAGMYATEAGHELRICLGKDENNLAESLLSRSDDHALESRAQEVRSLLEEKGWTVPHD